MTVIAAGCVALMVGLAQSPASEPAVREVTVQTPYGNKTYYYLPADASPQMRAAYKAREFAERGVVIVEQVQELKLETVWSERRSEAYRSNTVGTTPGSGASLPFNLGTTWRDEFLAAELTRAGTLPEPLIGAALALALAERSSTDKSEDPIARFQKALTTLLALERMNDPAQRALDRVVETEQKANEQLRQYLDGKRKPDVITTTQKTPPAVAKPDDENTGGGVLDAAIRQEQSARQREQEAFDRYQRAEPSDRDGAKRAWERASKEWDDARALLKAAREQAAERPKLPK